MTEDLRFEDLGFEIREPTQDFPFTIIVREAGDKNSSNWTELAGRTLGPLPNLAAWGLELAVQERVEGPERVVSSIIYVAHDLPPDAPDYPGRIPGTVLSSSHWETFGGYYDVRVVPELDHNYVSWATPLSPQQQTWIRLKEKLHRMGQVYPELEIVVRLPVIRYLGGLALRCLEGKYKVNTCRECAHFDEAEGKREYEKITHQFENGDGQMTKDIAQMMSQERHIRNLDEERIGLCTIRETLIERSFQACPKFEKVNR